MSFSSLSPDPGCNPGPYIALVDLYSYFMDEEIEVQGGEELPKVSHMLSKSDLEP